MKHTDSTHSADVTEGHFTLTGEQRRFKAMLVDYPRLMPYWDFKARECDLERLRADMGVLSHGEQVMVTFFAGVWCGENVLGFDLIDAARVLDESHLALIQRWLAQPEFP
jgi:hypothetical protein